MTNRIIETAMITSQRSRASSGGTKMLLPLTLLLLLQCVLSQNNCSSVDPFATAEKRLRRILFCNYDPAVIPLNPPDVTHVTAEVSLDLKHLVMSTDMNTLQVTAWLTTYWKDGNFRWNASEYGDQMYLTVTHTDIWTPDLTVYNADLTQVPLFAEKTNCIVSHQGQVTCAPRLKSQVFCQAQLQRWPYDAQFCKLQIGSWSYTGDDLIVTAHSQGFTTKDTLYNENNAWFLKEISATSLPLVNCCPNRTHPYVEYAISIQRHAGLFEAIFVLPLFVLAGTTLLSFWVRPLSLRITLCCASMTGTILLMTSLAHEVTTAGPDKPDIVVAYRDSLLFNFVSLVFSIIVPVLAATESPDFLLSLANILKNKGGRTGSFLLGPEPDNGENEDGNSEMTVIIGSSVRSSERPRCLVFAVLLDRTAFLALLVLYTLMLLALLP